MGSLPLPVLRPVRPVAYGPVPARAAGTPAGPTRRRGGAAPASEVGRAVPRLILLRA